MILWSIVGIKSIVDEILFDRPREDEFRSISRVIERARFSASARDSLGIV